MGLLSVRLLCRDKLRQVESHRKTKQAWVPCSKTRLFLVKESQPVMQASLITQPSSSTQIMAEVLVATIGHSKHRTVICKRPWHLQISIRECQATVELLHLGCPQQIETHMMRCLLRIRVRLRNVKMQDKTNMKILLAAWAMLILTSTTFFKTSSNSRKTLKRSKFSSAWKPTSTWLTPLESSMSQELVQHAYKTWFMAWKTWVWRLPMMKSHYSWLDLIKITTANFAILSSARLSFRKILSTPAF